MSTEYYIDPKITEEELIARLPEGLVIVDRHARWIGNVKGSKTFGKKLHRFPIKGRWHLAVFVIEGVVENFERFGGNKVTPILEALQKEFGFKVTSERGAVLGEDSWDFD